MPSHGDFDVIFGATSTYTVADKLTFLTDADIEIVSWGFVQTTAGAWTTLPCTAKLEVRDAGGANPVIVGGKTMSFGGSPAIGSRLGVTPTLSAGAGSAAGPIKVAPGKLVAVAVTQVGTPTAGAGAPFVVYRRKSFQPGQQTNDIDVSV